MFDDELYGTGLFTKALFSDELFKPGVLIPWTPPTDGTNLLWLKADSSDEFIFPDVLNPTLVGTWLDKSGNSNNATQATQSLQGSYDYTDKSVNFLGDGMLLPSIFSKCGFFIVRNANGQVGDNRFTYLLQNISDSYIFLATGILAYTMSIDGAMADTGSIGINGLDPYPADNTGGNIAVTGYIPFPTHDEIDLAYFNLNTSRAWTKLALDKTNVASNVDMHEVILLSSTPTTAERQRYEGYLAWKWEFVDKLPSDHPYKLNPPYIGD